MKITVSAVIIRTDAATISASVWDMPLLFMEFDSVCWYKNGAVKLNKKKNRGKKDLSKSGKNFIPDPVSG
jgi:hypothetical protein